MSGGHGRSGDDQGIHPNAKRLDFDSPQPKLVQHMGKRAARTYPICGSMSSNTTRAVGLVNCEECKKLLAKRKGRAA